MPGPYRVLQGALKTNRVLVAELAFDPRCIVNHESHQGIDPSWGQREIRHTTQGPCDAADNQLGDPPGRDWNTQLLRHDGYKLLEGSPIRQVVCRTSGFSLRGAQ